MSKFVLTAQLQLQAPNNVAQVVNQMQRQLNNVKVDVQVGGAAAATKDLKSVAGAAEVATNRAHRMGKAFAVSIKRFAAFSIATRAVGLLTQGLGGAVGEAVKFERELIKVAQVTGKTVSQLSDLVREIDNLATGMGVASASLLEVSRSLSQAGLSARDTKIALDSLAKTELAPTFADIKQTTEGAIAVMAQFKQGAGALEKQLGAINAVAGQFAVEAGDLISVIRRAGGVFKEAGGELNELIGLFTSVRATTRESADSIATGLRTIFTRIQRPKTIEFMKQFGVELTNMDGKFVGAYEAIARLSDALKGLEQGDIRFIRIAEELGGFRQIGKVIPLLKEFRTAEEARQAAIAGGDSLTLDAAAAQETLAVKIIKVKEEFLKLIREITQTTTFQVMADTALAFASSLIAIADAIKPLIPLIAALAAFKMAKMFGSFGSGLVGGMKNIGAGAPAGVNQGGRIRGFAGGGYVPGQGNRDTVPAMLTPGEFVIKKSSVKEIGAERLFAMNKYKKGSKVKGKPIMLDMDPGAIAGFFLQPDQGSERNRSFTGQTVSVTNQAVIDKLLKRQGPQGTKGAEAAAVAHGASLTKKEQAAIGISDGKTKVTAKALQGMASGNAKLTAGLVARYNADYKAGNVKAEGAPPVKVRGQMSGFYPGKGELASNAEVTRIVSQRTQEALYDAVSNVAVEANNFLDIAPQIDFQDQKVRDAAARLSQDENVAKTVEGFVFEGLIQGITNAQLGGGGLRFDFPATSIMGNKKLLKNLFGNNPLMDQVVKGDAKRTATEDAWKSIMAKLGSDINRGELEGIAGFSKGGKSDTVPAMLTPGEFVFNKSSAQRIGYGALNQMNKKGIAGFAAGGPVGVQHLSNGGVSIGGPGGKPMLGPGNIQGASEHFGAQLKALSAEADFLRTHLKGLDTAVTQSSTAQASHKNVIIGSSAAETKFMQREVALGGQRMSMDTQHLVLSKRRVAASQQLLSVTDRIDKITRQKAEADSRSLTVTQEETTATRANVTAMKQLVSATNLQAAGSKAAAGASGAQAAGAARSGIVSVGGSNAAMHRSIDPTGWIKKLEAEMQLFQSEIKLITGSVEQLNAWILNDTKDLQIFHEALALGTMGVEQTTATRQAENIVINSKIQSEQLLSKETKALAFGMSMLEKLEMEVAATKAEMAAQEASTERALIVAKKEETQAVMRLTAATVTQATGSAVAGAGAFSAGRAIMAPAQANAIQQGGGGGVGRNQGTQNAQRLTNEMEKLTLSTGKLNVEEVELSVIMESLQNGGIRLADVTNKEVLLLENHSTALTNDTVAEEKKIVTVEAGNKSNVKLAASGNKAAGALKGVASGGMGMMGGLIALQMVMAMIPTQINETDGALKMFAKTVGKAMMTLTAAAFMLVMFGSELSVASIATKLNTIAVARQGAAFTQLFSSTLLGINGNMLLAKSATFAATALTKLGWQGLLGLTVLLVGLYALGKTMSNLAKKEKEGAIEEGQVDIAGTAAVNESLWGLSTSLSMLSALIVTVLVVTLTAATGGMSLLIGTVAGFAVVILKGIGILNGLFGVVKDFFAIFGMGSSVNAIKLRAEADASASKATKSLTSATDEAAEAMKDVAAGTKTATEALASTTIADAYRDAGDALRAEAAAQTESSKGFFRKGWDLTKEVFTLGFADTETDPMGEKARLRTDTIAQTVKAGGLGKGSDALQAAQKAQGIKPEDIKAQKARIDHILKIMKETADLRARSAKEQIMKGTMTDMIDPTTGAPVDTSQMAFVAKQVHTMGAAFDALPLEEQKKVLKDLAKEYENQIKAVIDNTKQALAFNFGLRGIEGSVALASAKLDNLSQAFDTGAVQARNSINKLNAILESGSSMDPAELKASLTEVNKELKGFGVDPRTADNLTKSFEALNVAQGTFRKTTEQFIADSFSDPSKAGLSTEEFNNQLKADLQKAITAQTGDEASAKKLIDSMPKLSDEDVDAVMGGDLSAIEDKFGDINEKLVRELEILSKIAELTEKVAEENSKRLESEKALFDAQKKSIDLQKEAAKIIGEFGGVEFNAGRKRDLAIKKANVGTSRSGLSNLRTGSVSEIRRRNEQIRGGFSGIQSRGRASVAGGGKFFGQGPRVSGGVFSSQGQEVEAQSKSLKQAQEEQISTIKALIQIEKEQLKTLEEKNRLEKESLDALLQGDVEAFMDKQSAAGATAALASGDSRMAGLFGAGAMAGAFENLKKQQDAGVQSLFGQKLGGPGGLVERSAGVALGTRGITDPRQAALLAGSTAQEEDSKRRIRGLAGELAATGELGADLAGMDLQNAEFRVRQATIIVSQAQMDAQTKSREAEDIRAKGVARGNEILTRTEKELEQINDRNERIEEYERQQAELAAAGTTPGSIFVHDVNAAKSMDSLERTMTSRINDEGLAFASGAMEGPAKGKRNMVALNTAAILKGTERGRKILTVVARATKDTYAATKGLVTGTFKGIKQGKGLFASVAGGIKGGFGGAASSLRGSETVRALAGTRAGGGIANIFGRFGTIRQGFAAGRLGQLGGGGSTSIRAAQALGKSNLGIIPANMAAASDRLAKVGQTRTGRFGMALGRGMSNLAGKFAPETRMGKTAAFMNRWLNPKNFDWVKGLSKFGKDTKAAFAGGRAAATSTKGLGGFMAGRGMPTTARASAMAGRTGKAGGFLGKVFDAGAKMGKGSQSMAKVFAPMTTAFKTAKAGGDVAKGASAMGKFGVMAGAFGGHSARMAATTGRTVAGAFGGTGSALKSAGLSVAKSPVGKFVGKALTPVAVALGGIAGVMEKDRTATGTALEGGILGMITGSATKGDSMISKLANWFGAGIEKGGKTDVALGAIGGTTMAGLTGAAIGTMIAPGIGTAIGGGIGLLVGGIAEGWKYFTQEAVRDPIVIDEGGVSRTRDSAGNTIGTGGMAATSKVGVMQTDPVTGARSIELPPDALGSSVVDPASLSQSQAQAIENQRQQGVTTGSVLPGGGGATPGGAIARQAGTAGAAAAGMSPEAMAQMAMSFAAGTERLAGALNKFNTDLAANITELKNLKFQVKLDTTNVNVNFTGASFLETLSANIKTELLDHIVSNVIPSLKHDNAGNHTTSGGTGPAV